MAGTTNVWKKDVEDWALRGAAPPTDFYLALVIDDVAPGPDTATLAELVEIAAGNGYSAGGQIVARNSTSFPTLTQDDVNDRAYWLLKTFSWLATGGSIPASGEPPRYVVLLDNNATPSARKVYWYWDIGANFPTAANGETLSIAGLEGRAVEG